MSYAGKSFRKRFDHFFASKELKVKECALNIPLLSEYQEFLHKTIFDLREDGLTFNEIATWLNDRKYKTPRKHIFKGTHVFSLLKRRLLRSERINRTESFLIERLLSRENSI